jgi:polygalacturonase
MSPLSRLLAGVLGAALLAGARADFPVAARPAAPDPAPDFPRGFDRFEPPADLPEPLAGTPALAEWNRTAGRGDTITFTGSRLSTSNDGSDNGFTVFSQAGAKRILAAATVRRVSGGHVAITLPAALPKWATYLAWPRNSAGYGRPAVLNATEAWWIGPDLATRGDSFAVYGRNLAHGNAATRSWVYLQDAGGAGRWLHSREANPYRAEFAIPNDVANGEYRVWIHNGHGARLGWSGPLKLTIDDGTSWTRATFNVRDFGAKGDGKTDDLAAIQAALAAAGASPGATVYFPAGHYAVSATITNVPPQVRWRGAGMGSTFIQPHATFGTANYGLVLAALRRVEMRDLTFDTLGRIRGAVANNLLQIRGSSRVAFTRVRFSQEEDRAGADAAPLDAHLCDHVTLRGCDFLASGGLFFGTSRQVFLEGCKFRGLNDNNAFVYVWGGSEVSVAQCSGADFRGTDPADGHGWAQGRFLSGSGLWGSCRHVYFGQNRTRNLTVRPGFGNQNTGEQFLFEGLDTLIRGTPNSAGPDWVQFDGFTDDYTGQILVVVRGAGQGQSRQIAAFDPALGRITVDQPWTVAPDVTSTVMVGHYMSRMAVYGNFLSGKTRAVTSPTHIASAGVEPFGGCVDLVVAHNTFQRLRYGISNWSMTNRFGDGQVTGPNYFNQFTDNQFLGCRQGIVNLLARWEDRPTIQDESMLGNVFRGNRMFAIKDAAFVFQTWTGMKGAEMSVFDRNSAATRGPGVTGEPAGLVDQLWTRNRLRGRDGTFTIIGATPP